MYRILIIGAGGTAGFNFVKSLREADEDFYIVGADSSKYHIELTDLDRRYIIPGANDTNFLNKINEIIKNERIDFVHCQPDVTVCELAARVDKINAKTLLPNTRTVELCQNKALLNRELKKMGIAVPEAYWLKDEGDLHIACESLLVSGEKAWLRGIHGSGSTASLPVKTREQVENWIQYWIDMKGYELADFMISEFLPGPEYAWQSVWHKGTLVRAELRQRIEYLGGKQSISGQTSSPSVARTVVSDKANLLGYDAVKAIDPDASGIFCVDMKTDEEGRVKLIEINAGRFFSTSYFFTKAGNNMPLAYVKLGLGEDVLVKRNIIPHNWYWIRMMDMGYKLIKNKWTSIDIRD